MQSRQRSAARPRRKPLTALNCVLLLGLLLACNVAKAQWDFQRIIQTAERHYSRLGYNLGPAEGRIEAWNQLLQASRNLSEYDQLDAVNRFFNRQLRFVDDAQVWQQKDYWATPLEALVQGAGDCEDYALAKYFSLRHLGVASDKLRITYVKALNYNLAHMVLSYYASPTAEPLVLDNLIEQILPAAQRPDLLPVFAFNAEGLYRPGGGPRSTNSKKLSRWQDLLQKMHAEGFTIAED
jgi:predicted transglutaminase-like cysteine proteinase